MANKIETIKGTTEERIKQILNVIKNQDICYLFGIKLIILKIKLNEN